MKDTKTKEQFIQLRAEGKSFQSISEEIGVSKPTLIEWSKDFAIQIANYKAIEMEALQERYFVQKRQRVVLFGEQIAKLKEELSKRDLKEVSTDKLFELLAKYATALSKEDVQPTFKGEEEAFDFSLNTKKIVEWTV